MPVIVPGDTHTQLLAILSDPKAAKQNLLDLQSMNEQIQRDQKRNQEILSETQRLQNDLKDRETKVSEYQSMLEEREARLIELEKSLDAKASDNTDNTNKLSLKEIELKNKEKELRSLEKVLGVRENTTLAGLAQLDKDRSDLNQLKEKLEKWQHSISSTLLLKP